MMTLDEVFTGLDHAETIDALDPDLEAEALEWIDVLQQQEDEGNFFDLLEALHFARRANIVPESFS